ncbi:MAG TPA: urea ABC transporter permease subunit UrtB, partial [Candidatus Cybelea sp.]|nr:urea ABC transporter permease subunit UrtB [Candidatus Cybelea sp.]
PPRPTRARPPVRNTMFRIFAFRCCAAALLVCLTVFEFLPHAVAAESVADLVTKLGSGGFDDKLTAVDALGQSGDPKVVPVLKALLDGRLFVSGDGKVVIGEADGDNLKLTDAVLGTDLGSAPSDGFDRIKVNNRLRGGIAGALSQLMLFSPDRADRLAAAQDALKHGSPELAAALRKALAGERDPEVRAAMQLGIYGAQLFSSSNTERIAAINGLSASTDPQVHNLLAELRNAPGISPEARAALDAALGSMAGRQRLIDIAASLFEGISLGSVLLLAAIGLAITFGVMGVINMAHGEMIMLGAYSAFMVQELFRSFLPPGWIDLYLLVAVPVGFLVAGAIGVALERSVIRFLYGRPLETMLATWGISLILQQAVRTVFGAPNKAVANPAWMTGGYEIIGGFSITWNRVYIIVFCFIVLGALALVTRRTQFGLQMRAVTQNRDMAAVMGIPTARVDALTFGLGSGIAGMAGVALSQIGNVSPNLGTIYIVDSFLVVVFGGVGNLAGTLVGAMSLGIANKFLEPVAGAILGKVLVLVAIILFIQRRPRGLFALKGRAAEQ